MSREVSTAKIKTVEGDLLSDLSIRRRRLHFPPPSACNAEALSGDVPAPSEGRIIDGFGSLKRLVQVDQKPIGRTPRSNLATYTGLFDYVRRIFAETKAARARRYTAGRFSFSVAQGRCETCEGEGFVCVELLFMPSVYAPCSTCCGARYNAKTLEIQYRGQNIAEVVAMTVDRASEFFAEQPQVSHALTVLQEVGLGYLRLGQPATELSGGEAQRIKLATELQRNQRGNTLYVLDEPTTGLHPSDVQRLVAQLDGLAELGNTVIVVERDLDALQPATTSSIWGLGQVKQAVQSLPVVHLRRWRLPPGAELLFISNAASEPAITGKAMFRKSRASELYRSAYGQFIERELTVNVTSHQETLESVGFPHVRADEHDL